jgi:hypothetical protein
MVSLIIVVSLLFLYAYALHFVVFTLIISVVVRIRIVLQHHGEKVKV